MQFTPKPMATGTVAIRCCLHQQPGADIGHNTKAQPSLYLR